MLLEGFNDVQSYEKALKVGKIELKGRRYTVRSYRQMAADNGQRFRRNDVLGLSGRWRQKFQGLFCGVSR